MNAVKNVIGNFVHSTEYTSLDVWYFDTCVCMFGSFLLLCLFKKLILCGQEIDSFELSCFGKFYWVVCEWMCQKKFLLWKYLLLLLLMPQPYILWCETCGAFKWKLPLLKLIIRDIKNFFTFFRKKEMILVSSCCRLTDRG